MQLAKRLVAAGTCLVLGLGFAMLAIGQPSVAQEWPAKPIRMIVPFGAGSATDIAARIVSQHLSQVLGQPIVIDNKPGADGAIAGLELKKAAPDGYTLMGASNSPIVVVPWLQKSPPYDPIADFVPIGFIGRSTFFVVVHPSVPAKTIPELFAHAKANPKKLNYATGNTTSIVSTALLAKHGDVEMQHIPYKSEPQALTDLLSGQVHLMIGAYSTFAAQIGEGKLRPLVTILPQRSPLLPDVPSITEQGMAKFPVGPWAAIFGPAKLPKPIVERLSRELIAILNKPDVREALLKNGISSEPMTADELGTMVSELLETWRVALKDAGIEPQ